MAEIIIEKKINWRQTLLSFKVGETKEFEKEYFGKLQTVRQTASNLSSVGKWMVSSNTSKSTFIVLRKE